MTGAMLRTLIVADARVLWRDPLLIWMTAVPIGMALVIRLLAQALVNLFPEAAPAFPQYYPVVLGGYLMTAPGMVGFVIGFLLLDERDAGTLRALRVTPLSMRHYLAYRIVGPLIAGTASTVIGYPITGLVPIAFSTLVVLATLAGLAAPLLALVLAASAPNKVAGFAVVKVLNSFNLLPIAAFFVPTPLQYVAGVVPTYWPMRALWSAAAGEEYAAFVLVGAVVGTVAVVLSAVWFERRLLQP
jgi:hypothetical protein